MSVIPPPTRDGPHHVPIDPALSSTTLDVPKKRKKKRHRENEQDADDAGVAELKEKKKKRKKRHHEQDGAEEQIVAEPAAPSPPPAQIADVLPVKHKKKKRKDKGKQREAAPSVESQIDPALASSSNSSTDTEATDLISAIVAAAAGTHDSPTPDHGPAPLEPQFHPQMLPHPSQQTPFMPYPFTPYGFGAPPYMPSAMQPTLFPSPMSAPFSELSFGSNDDVLRALQSLDMSKITNVLKTLGEAAAAAGEPSLGELPQGAPLDQVPMGSGAILGIPPQGQSTSSGHGRTLNMNLPGTGHHTSPDHAYILANKWLNAAKLAELVKTEGLVYKKGKFSAIEEEQLKAAIENYRLQRSFTQEDMQELMFPKIERNKDNAFWTQITAAVPQRPIIAVYHHVRRTYHPLKLQGIWSAEEDNNLLQAVVDLGQQWEKVSLRVGRMSSDCRDRYRNHIVNRDIRVRGVWTRAEEEDLIRIVTDMTVKQGKGADNDVFWGRVSELMGGTRGRQQCRIKWTDALSKTVKNEGQKPRWSPQDAHILVHKIDSLDVRDDTEISWKTLADPNWNLWSAHTLQRRWLTMKRSIKGFEDMTHQEIMDILRVKKAQLLPMAPLAPRKRKERKVISAASVTDDPPGVGTDAGPSTAATPAVQDSSDDETSSDSDSD
ncbi:DNA-binding protein REB1 [Hypsizygus marmoreus]|uniref:DNA-binding protein REB1 n=1 Tax=Hypsizygus marmoreus TaxID=39966 RepID=A0A369JN31_HYPMA|nr:DNA-binding protein REB1 [Hypsizygus marmoreus]